MDTILLHTCLPAGTCCSATACRYLLCRGLSVGWGRRSVVVVVYGNSLYRVAAEVRRVTVDIDLGVEAGKQPSLD